MNVEHRLGPDLPLRNAVAVGCFSVSLCGSTTTS